MKSFLSLRGVIVTTIILVIGDKSNFAAAKGSGGRCGVPEKCCTGRDSSCFVNNGDNPMDENGLLSFGYSINEPCYCDEGCLETGDCCSDYEAVCTFEVVNCDVSKWSKWSSCDRSCGKGVQSRTRLINQHPSPGGKRCPSLSQNRACLGNRCSAKYRKYKNPIVETAALLPAKYLALKPEKPKWDVRENLFVHQRQLIEQKKMLMKNKSSMGNKNSINNNLILPSLNAIDNALIEEGYQSDQPQQERNLEYCIVFELAKVTKACKRDRDFEFMKKGQQMCALCPEDAKRENLGGRCRGHGVDSELTRWRSTVHSKCHGKWKRVQETRNCPCKKGPDFIFV